MDKDNLIDLLLDDRCEMYGCQNTIMFLLDSGVSAKELENYFIPEDIAEAHSLLCEMEDNL